MDKWINIDDYKPSHLQKCKTLGADGRQFDCEYFKCGEQEDGYFNLIGSAFWHDNVTHWKPMENNHEKTTM